jgi:hypothetical protein
LPRFPVQRTTLRLDIHLAPGKRFSIQVRPHVEQEQIDELMTLALLISSLRRRAQPRVSVNQSVGQFVNEGGEFRFAVVARPKAQGVRLAHPLEHDGVDHGLREAETGNDR